MGLTYFEGSAYIGVHRSESGCDVLIWAQVVDVGNFCLEQGYLHTYEDEEAFAFPLQSQIAVSPSDHSSSEACRPGP